ncbi:hypothetical protein HXX76_010987 [Chlamydomonas incerta]|uniref:DNA (cytosine-5-)-methyltransferase n=1 Tax=Chlamydomonas incerta TaxID=51695 RepID=A0A835SL71_CHLIN|nr:hypothetical protein HXX76_010987 [Chlamydomonas incerta]|eukprot:KAG2429217.1 hypothetical protein HXX76_010987 [Chlamydomonas incerta]
MVVLCTSGGQVQLMTPQEYQVARSVRSGGQRKAGRAGQQAPHQASSLPPPLPMTHTPARGPTGSPTSPTSRAAASRGTSYSSSSGGGDAAATAANPVAYAAVAGGAFPEEVIMPGTRTDLVDHVWREYFQGHGVLRLPVEAGPDRRDTHASSAGFTAHREVILHGEWQLRRQPAAEDSGGGGDGGGGGGEQQVTWTATRCWRFSEPLRPGALLRLPGGGVGGADRFYLVQCILVTTGSPGSGDSSGSSGPQEPVVQLRLLLHGRDTVLEDAAAEHELFLLDTSAAAADQGGSAPGGGRGGTIGTSGSFDKHLSSTDQSSDEARWAARLRPEETLVSLPLRALDQAEVLKAKDLSGRPCDHTHSLANAQADLKLQRSSARAVAAGLPPTYAYRHVYCPHQGLFRPLRLEKLQLGQWIEPQQLRQAAATAAAAGSGEVGPRLHCMDAAAAAAPLPDGSGFTLAGSTYQVGEFMYVDAAAAGGQQGGPWAVVQLAGVAQPEELPSAPGGGGGGAKGAKGGKRVPQLLKLQVRRFLRPEDVCGDLAYAADWWDLCAPAPRSSLMQLPVTAVAGKCAVVVAGARAGLEASVAAGPALPGVRALDTFQVVGTALPPGWAAAEAVDVAGEEADRWATDWAAAASSAVASAQRRDQSAAAAASSPPVRPLATLDIFAGCGGLSEGLHQSGVSSTLWAVEFEPDAAKAYQENNPQTAVLVGDCNTLLQEAMARAGQAKYCVVARGRDTDPEEEEGAPGKATPRPAAAGAAAGAGPGSAPRRLPLPGQVELLVGGPPCQGFSGLNKHRGDGSSLQKNSLVGSYLSYCDFYRPRYFVLENVMGFVAYLTVKPPDHKSAGASDQASEEEGPQPVNYFKLALRTLLDMGYQVRFGALNAGNHGVPQSRKRVFIIAALPQETLPTWPRPMHSFQAASEGGHSREGQQDQPLIPVPGGRYFANGAGKRLAGTPLRAVTVRDAIGNLPPIAPGSIGDPAVPLPLPESALQRRLALPVAAVGTCAETGSVSSQLLHHVVLRVLCTVQAKTASIVPPGADLTAVERNMKDIADGALLAGADLGAAGELGAFIAATGLPLEQYVKRWEEVSSSLPYLIKRRAKRNEATDKRLKERAGVYGRLRPDSYFRTATTKAGVDGWSLHPDMAQQRMVSVRELARSQGFPDRHVFGGRTVKCYRQVGNAVPPPVALALGLQLRQALQQQEGPQGHEGEEEEWHEASDDEEAQG